MQFTLINKIHQHRGRQHRRENALRGVAGSSERGRSSGGLHAPSDPGPWSASVLPGALRHTAPAGSRGAPWHEHGSYLLQRSLCCLPPCRRARPDRWDLIRRVVFPSCWSPKTRWHRRWSGSWRARNSRRKKNLSRSLRPRKERGSRSQGLKFLQRSERRWSKSIGLGRNKNFSMLPWQALAARLRARTRAPRAARASGVARTPRRFGSSTAR